MLWSPLLPNTGSRIKSWHSADNTNSNFGGLRRRGKNNLYTKLQATLPHQIFGLGCVVHIIHNAAHACIGTLPLDIESVLIKVFGYFRVYTVRVERLRAICESAGQEHWNLLGYANVRWLSMLPALERVLLLFEPLKTFFMAEENCPRTLKDLFDVPKSELWLTLAHSCMSLFHNTVLLLEGQDRSAPESAMMLYEFRKNLQGAEMATFVH